MEAVIEYVEESTQRVRNGIHRFMMDCGAENQNRWFDSLILPVDIAEGLLCKVIESRSSPHVREIGDFVVASLITRYLFELTANVSVMLNSETEALRMERQDAWLRMKDMDVIGESYAVPYGNMSKRSQKRILKDEGRIKKIKGLKQKRQEHSIDSEYSIPISEAAFLFEDPWGLSVAKKLRYMPLDNAERFLEQWKIYSHISHASAFSLTPTWMEPVPVNDAVQAYGVLLSVVSNYVGIDFSAKKFIDDFFCLIYPKRE